MNRTVLTRMTVFVIAAGVIGAGFVFGTLVKPSDRASAQADIPVPMLSYADIRQLAPGKGLRLMGFNGPVIIYRPTPSDLASLNLLNDHVWDSSLDTWSESLGVFVHGGSGSGSECYLERVPESRATAGRQWLGGYACHDFAYDLAGRSIASERYSWNGRVAQVPNLVAPRVAYEETGIVLLPVIASESQQITQRHLLP